MSSSILRVVAVLLAVGAIVIGYMGYQAGSQPKTEIAAPAKVEPPGEAVIFAAREIAAGHAITTDDLAIGHVPTRPVRAYGASQDLIGKKPKLSISTGEMLLASHFPSHSQLAQSLGAGERAMAVKVDEVIGTGGFIEPGDTVDILLFLGSDRQEIGEHSSAQVVLSNVRVLAFGNVLEQPTEGAGSEISRDDNLLNKAQKTTAKNEKSEEKPSGKSSKTAVLAVPAAETTKLMLADSSGKIRLALRGVANRDETMLGTAGIQDGAAGGTIAAYVQEKQQPGKAKNLIELRDLVAKKPTHKTRSGTLPVARRAIVHKGTSTETVVLGPSGTPETITDSGIITR
ncbi:MAG: Flp pilus assembly protein CpaB [Methylococcales bacterium]